MFISHAIHGGTKTLDNTAARSVELLCFIFFVQQMETFSVVTLVDSSSEQASAYNELQFTNAGSVALTFNYLKLQIQKHNSRNYQSTLCNIPEERRCHNFLLNNMETQLEWDTIIVV
jgi:hypothetical protein